MTTSRRRKRSNEELEKDIFQATWELIKEKGFASVTLTAIAKKAMVEPIVIYNRYQTLDNLLKTFAKKYDYWFSDILASFEGNLYTQEGYKHIFHQLFDSLQDNVVMQQLLRWELSSDNETTNYTSKLRESHTIPLAENFGAVFKNTKVDISAVSALMVGGIYYLILHSNLSGFSGVDVNSLGGKKRILDAIDFLAEKYFFEVFPNQEKINIVRKLKERNVPLDIIAESTELPLEIVKKLL